MGVISSAYAQGTLYKPAPDECFAESGELCIFPFFYKGNTYDQCTTDSSSNGKAWCAIGLKNRFPGDIEADTYQLKDCQQSCGSGVNQSSRCQCTQKTNSNGGGKCQRYIKAAITVTLTHCIKRIEIPFQH